jgi:hypothetical protein
MPETPSRLAEETDAGHSEWPFGMPIPGPIEGNPLTHLGDGDPIDSARLMLTTALDELAAAGVQFGVYDGQIIRWLATWDYAVVTVVASLLHRALHATPAPPGAGRPGA